MHFNSFLFLSAFFILHCHLFVNGFVPRSKITSGTNVIFTSHWRREKSAVFSMNSNLDEVPLQLLQHLKKGLLAAIIGASTSLSSPTYAIEDGINPNPNQIVGSEISDKSEKYKVFNEVWKIVNDNYVDGTFNNNDWVALKKNYLEKLANGADENAITKKALSLLGDKYTRLLDKKFFESLWEYDAIGVGLLFQSDPEKPMTIAAPPISGSSGEAAGIKKGDVVYSINGVSTEKMNAMQVLDMMSNDDGEYMKLEYGTPSNQQENEPHKTVNLKRSKQKANNPVSSFSQKLQNGKVVGYASLTEFNSEAVPSLREAILSFEKANVDYIVLDLRGNTGGGIPICLEHRGHVYG